MWLQNRVGIFRVPVEAKVNGMVYEESTQETFSSHEREENHES